MKKQENKRVASYWGKRPPEQLKNYYRFPPLRDYIYSCVTGEVKKTDEDSLIKWIIDKYLDAELPVEACLSLCCGFGELERKLAENRVFHTCTGIDLSEGAIGSAKEKALEEGFENITYLVGDLNNQDLGSNKYDLIYAKGALHHISNLEFTVSNICKALKPGGIVVCNEYVGPKHQKLPFRQREIINSVIHLIPLRMRFSTEESFVPVLFRFPMWRRLIFEAYRLVTLQSGETATDYTATDEEMKSSWPSYKLWLLDLYNIFRKIIPAVNAERRSFRYGKVWDEDSRRIKLIDPSECVRSDEIIPVFKYNFKHIDVRYYNGSILFYALDRKFFNEYNPDKKEDRDLLDLLLNIEKTLINTGELTSDHAYIIAKKE